LSGPAWNRHDDRKTPPQGLRLPWIEDSGCGKFIDIFDLNTLISHFDKPAIPRAKLIGRQIAAETIRPQRTMRINQRLALAQFLW
jgi:hypothetical protein